jgi:hypothetical protein
VEHQLEIINGNHKHLGAMVGVNREGLAKFVQDILAAHQPILDAIAHEDCPAQLALMLARVCARPKPNYLICMRAMPLYSTIEAMATFDKKLRKAISVRLNLPLLPEAALLTLQQPIRNGGVGFRSMKMAVPAASWTAALQAAQDIQFLAEEAQHTLASVTDRENCFDLLKQAGCPTTSAAAQNEGVEYGDEDWRLLPHAPQHIIQHYAEVDRKFRLQRLLTGAIEDRTLANFKETEACTELVNARLKACSMKYSGLWLTTPISNQEYCFTDVELSVALRQRLGLSPLPHAVMPDKCVCGKHVFADLWHAHSCVRTRRRSVVLSATTSLRLSNCLRASFAATPPSP